MAAGAELDPFMGVIVPYTNFALFAFVLWYFARKPAAAAAAAKKAKFEAMLAEANAEKAKAEERLKELNDRRAKLDDEIATLQKNARAAATAEAERIVGEAERLADHLKTEAKRIGQAELEKARLGLREEIVAAIRDDVQAKLKNDLDNAAHLKLVKNRIGGLQSLKTEG